MPATTLRTAIFLAIVVFVLPSYSQNKAPESDPKSTTKPSDSRAPEKQHFYYHSWGKGEIKVCDTYSGVPNVIVCDSADDIEWKSSLLNLIAENNRRGMLEEQSYREALAFAAAHGKTFVTSFSEDPWPKPQTGFKLSVWSCSIDGNKVMNCGLGGRTSKTTAGE